MYIDINTLKETIAALSTLTRKSPIPAMNYARVTIDGNYIGIEATDGSVSVKRLIWDSNNNAYESFSLFIPQIKSLIKGQSGLAFLTTDKIEFESGLSVKLDSLGVDNLIETRFIDSEGMATNFDVGGSIKDVLYAVNKDDTRFHLDNACIHNHQIIATDGHRLEIRPFRVFQEESDIVNAKLLMPRLVCQIISGSKIKHGWFSVEPRGDNYQVQFSSPSWVICWRSDGDYPDYVRVIRKDNGFMKKVSVNRKAMLSAVKSLTQTLDKNNPGIHVKLNGQVELSTDKASVVVPIVSTNVNESYRDIERILNGFYLQDALTACKDERVCIESCANIVNDMVFFRSPNQDSLIMPIKK